MKTRGRKDTEIPTSWEDSVVCFQKEGKMAERRWSGGKEKT